MPEKRTLSSANVSTFPPAKEAIPISHIVGIDVGGTNTDAVLLRDSELVGAVKVPTDRDRLVDSTSEAFTRVLAFADGLADEAVEFHLSTTLATNAIIEGRGEPAAVLAVPGPGLRLEDLGFDFPLYPLGGAVDHRGRETAPLDEDEALAAVRRAAASGMRALAVAGKFATRNPAHELALARLASESSSAFGSITLSHRLSGRLNFPRRLVTSFLNARVARLQGELIAAARDLFTRRGVHGRIFILKADGGTMGLAESASRPVETILSGPAASVMGTVALAHAHERSAVILDIGGTSTDLAVLIDGKPLYEREGAEIAGRKTSVPALFSRSIGLGGDSEICFDGEILRIGPHRSGRPAAMGGRAVTPTDAAIALGLAPLGERNRALEALAGLGAPFGLDPPALARRILEAFSETAAAFVRDVYARLAARSAYTISQVLTPRAIAPSLVILLGAPAATLAPSIAAHLDLPYEVLPHHAAANAVGAAASRPTAAISLRADTALGTLVVPELGFVSGIRHPLLFDAKRAREEAVEKALALAVATGIEASAADVELVEEEDFHVVQGFHTAGRILALRAQIRPEVRRVSQKGIG